MIKKNLEILKKEFTIHRFDANETVPPKVLDSGFYWIGKTDEELSIVCESGLLNGNDKSSGGWSIIKIMGKLDFSLVGILAEISNALKDAGISIVALSTYDTDYIMLKKDRLNEAKKALADIGYQFITT